MPWEVETCTNQYPSSNTTTTIKDAKSIRTVETYFNKTFILSCRVVSCRAMVVVVVVVLMETRKTNEERWVWMFFLGAQMFRPTHKTRSTIPRNRRDQFLFLSSLSSVIVVVVLVVSVFVDGPSGGSM